MIGLSVIDLLVAWWRDNAPVFLLGTLLWSAAGCAVVARLRTPLPRQRLAEATVAGWLVWLLLAAVPGPGDVALAPAPAVSGVASLDAAPSRLPPVSTALAAQTSLAERADDLIAGLIDALGVVLASGSLLATLWLLAAGLLLGRLLHRAEPAPADVLAVLASLRVPLPRGARLVVSELAWRPFCCGLCRPTIVLPRAMLATVPSGQPAALRAVLLHELAHLVRGDLRGRWLFALAMPLAWWNPLFWRLRRQAHLAAELLADELAARWHHDRAAYARSLIDLAELLPRARRAPVAALGTFGPQTHFTQRMTMLLRRQTPLATRSSRLASLARSTAAIALAALASLSWTAPRLGAQQEKTTRSAAPTETAPSAAPRQEPLRYSMKLHYGDEKDLGTIVTRLAGRGLTIEKLEIEPAEDGKRRTAVLGISMPSLDLLREVSGLVEPAVVSTLMPTTVKPAGRRGPASAARAPRVRFNFEKTDVRKVIDALAKISGSNIVVADEVQGEVTMRIFDLPWREALDIAARQVSGKVSERDGGVLVVEKAAAAK